MRAWEKGLKGVTIFRDGCKRAGILTTGTDKQEESVTEELIMPNDTGIITEDKLPRGYIIAADDNVIGLKRKIMTGCGSMHVVAMFDPVTGELLEAYLSKGSTGGCQSNLAAVSRLISLSARAGVDVYTIVDQLQSCMAYPSYYNRTYGVDFMISDVDNNIEKIMKQLVRAEIFKKKKKKGKKK